MNKYYAVAYRLHSIKDGVDTLVEEAPENDPFVFISGFGTTIPKFESNIEKLSKGETFDFTIPQAEAYGEYVAERVIELDKQMFVIDGKFDDSLIYVDAIIPLQNEDGMRFNGRVLEITETKVKVDLNHPLAGYDLRFEGSVTICREATNEEIQQMINRLSGGGCGGCGGGGCHGSCHGEGGCGGDCNCNK